MHQGSPAPSIFTLSPERGPARKEQGDKRADSDGDANEHVHISSLSLPWNLGLQGPGRKEVVCPIRAGPQEGGSDGGGGPRFVCWPLPRLLPAWPP